MAYEVLTLQDQQAINWRQQIRELLAEFSAEVSQKMAEGSYDDILEKTYRSPHAYFCLAVGRTQREAVGMYIGTYMPVGLSSRLYIDGVVTAKQFRRQGVFNDVLRPHMIELGRRLGCDAIDFTSSKPAAQAAYLQAGFSSPTTAFRLRL